VSLPQCYLQHCLRNGLRILLIIPSSECGGQRKQIEGGWLPRERPAFQRPARLLVAAFREPPPNKGNVPLRRPQKAEETGRPLISLIPVSLQHVQLALAPPRRVSCPRSSLSGGRLPDEGLPEHPWGNSSTYDNGTCNAESNAFLAWFSESLVGASVQFPGCEFALASQGSPPPCCLPSTCLMLSSRRDRPVQDALDI